MLFFWGQTRFLGQNRLFLELSKREFFSVIDSGHMVNGVHMLAILWYASLIEIAKLTQIASIDTDRGWMCL